MSTEPTGRLAAAADGVPRHAVRLVEEPGEDWRPEAVEFVRFCYRRRGVSWPDLYDDMCAVAARREFRGLCYEQLEALGIGFALGALPGLARLANRVIFEERASLGSPGALSA